MYSKTCILCQRTSLKRWFGNRTMTSNCDVTNSAQQIQMTTLCHWMKPPHENFLRTPLALCPSQKTLRPIGVSTWLRACPVSGTSIAVGPQKNVPAGPPSHSLWASSPNSELRVKPYRDTPIVSFSQAFANSEVGNRYFVNSVATAHAIC